jgi:hypothetical protein
MRRRGKRRGRERGRNKAGGWKRFKKYFAMDENEDREVDHIFRIVKAYESVTTSMTVQSCWEKAGFTYQQRDGTFYLMVHEGRLGQHRIFKRFGRRTIQ